MKYRVLIVAEAEADLREIIQQLRVESPVTVVKLQQELMAISRQLEEFPYAYQASAEPTVRRACLHSTRHTVYFRVRGRVVEVAAILPQRIDPSLTRKRLGRTTVG